MIVHAPRLFSISISMQTSGAELGVSKYVKTLWGEGRLKHPPSLLKLSNAYLKFLSSSL